MPVLVERIAKCPATTENDDVCDGVWRVLENGVLAVSTAIEVDTARGRRRVWCDPRGGGRLVCEHGWGAYHLSGWNGPRAHLFPKPGWTTCDCLSATGLCGGPRGTKRRLCVAIMEEQSTSTDSEASGGESDRTVVVDTSVGKTKPSYYDTLVAQHGTTELRPGLRGARVPGVLGPGGDAFFMVKGDGARVLRCRHGHTTNTLATQGRERRRRAAGLVLAALIGRRVAHKALGVAPIAATAHGTAKVLVTLLVALQAAREARRTRRGAAAPCGCAPAHVKACVLAAAGR